jgi:penicillin-binding protein 1A
MAKKSILKLGLYVLVSPLILASRVMIKFRMCGLNDDLQRCLEAVDTAPSIPNRFVVTLVTAEDHRSLIHPGVDPISILRVLLLWVRTGRAQGASTIEQQLVRVVLECYEKTLRRKLREQLVAVGLSRKRSKAQIAKAYLGKAFYGSGRYGLSALNFTCKPNLETASQECISYMVARLKYPEPLYPTAEWHQRVNSRVHYITGRLKRSANPAFERDAAKARRPSILR